MKTPALPQTATVETLTAEVRVLMVGSRQITLSVFRQLDWVKWDDLEPFGRINDRDTEHCAVGRKRSDGTLARSTAGSFDPIYWSGTPEWNRYQRELQAAEQQIAGQERRIADARRLAGDEALGLVERGRHAQDVEWASTSLREAQKKFAEAQEQLEILQEERDELPARQAARFQRKQAFETLPLIVLAGLR